VQLLNAIGAISRNLGSFIGETAILVSTTKSNKAHDRDAIQ